MRPHTVSHKGGMPLRKHTKFYSELNPSHTLSNSLPPFKYRPFLFYKKLKLASSEVNVTTIISNFIKDPLTSGNTRNTEGKVNYVYF